jgi:hypothetical protein
MREILQAIGLIKQREAADKAKRKKKKAIGGLQSRLRDPQSSLTDNDKVLLKSMLLGANIDQRTDEGSLMGLRQAFPNF